MNKTILFILAFICFAASVVMYVIGNDSSHLSELADYFYVPIPLGLVAILLALKK